jgi:hypothetical protein
MEVKFAQLLNSYRVRAEETTKKIADLVAEFDEAWRDYQQAIIDVEDIEDEEEKEAKLEEIRDFEQELKDADSELVKRIESWDKNKEVWAKGQKALAEKRAAKKAGTQSLEGSVSASPTISTQIETPPQVAPTPQPMSVGADGQISGLPNNSDFKGEGGVVKKKSNSGWWILAGVIGIVTLGAVVMKKE